MKTLLLALVLAAPPALAQSMPDWAEPSPSSSSASPEASAMPGPPGLPGDGGTPTQVPIDGGLGLLALAGGVFAGRRLSRDR